MNSIKVYDNQLQSKLSHLKLHPAYLPHIGLKYNEARAKTLIIAESHYVHKDYNNKFSVEDWYNNPKVIYQALDAKNKGYKGWFNTRQVLEYYQSSNPLAKGHGIFNNLEIAYKEIGSEVKLFDECVYLNYFQRPSEVEGDSIKVQEIDSEIALENLMVLNEVLKPNKIIFVSSKAYHNFMSNVTKAQKDQLPYVGSVPHPSASSWWNRKSKKYGLNGAAATGKQKFIRIMTPK
ncbi:hypothetical protein [Lacinutrix algicola]|uniref:hypothetical protein n=1 Tax=Lacinutrix algicola TaxID=342954 RepID=UPI0006E277EA|nr:hypothetical protein [Lacinutrix algicola]